MNNKDLLIAMALDLKRVAIGSHAHSVKMADRFFQEVLKREKLINRASLSQTVNGVLTKMEKQLQNPSSKRFAEDALLYSNVLLSIAKKL